MDKPIDTLRRYADSIEREKRFPVFVTTDRMRPGVLCLGLWATMTITALWLRPLLPISETRYAAVAWEMWANDSFLVPLLNGEAYSHKPPLLFWMIHLGWSVLGISEAWLRLIAPLFALASLIMTYRIGRQLWPERPTAAILGTFIFLGSAPFCMYATVTMFDMPVVFFTLLAVSSILRACRSGTIRTLVAGGGVALGLGVLAKGPVIFVYVLPVALSAPWWSGRASVRWPRWYLGVGGAILLGPAIALAWAVPAAYAGGPAYAQAILWGQTTGRLIESFAHARPFWWYAVLLPVIMLPWLAWPRLWHLVRNSAVWRDPGIRFCLAWSLSAFFLLSLISGKQLHYLLPLLPALSLAAGFSAELSTTWRHREGLFAGIGFLGTGLLMVAVAGGFLPVSWTADITAKLDGSPAIRAAWLTPGLILAGFASVVAMGKYWSPLATTQTLTGLVVLLFVVVHIYWNRILGDAYDIRPASRYIAELEHKGYPLAQFRKYHGQYHFYGRMKKSVSILEEGHLQNWLDNHPNGRILLYPRHLPETDTSPEYAARFRGRYITVWNREQIAINPDLSRLE